MISPFLCYAAAFTVSIAAYFFGWSGLYPPLSPALLIFLVATVVICASAHYLALKNGMVSYRPIENEKLKAVGVTVLIYVLWVVEFIYEGGVPLIKILFNLPYNYRTFGVPSLHVFVVTFSSFFTVYLFHVYLAARSKKILLLFAVNLAAAILIYSRAMLFFNLSGCLFVYILSVKGFPVKRIVLIALLIIPLFYFFGVLGSLRVSREADEDYNNENFMDTGHATHAFRTSPIPGEYFWSYIYVSSPLANLQLNMDKKSEPEVSFRSVYWTGMYELLPDFISKRIHTIRDTKPPKEYRINYSFNVSTIYSRAYSYSGWGGMCLVALFLIGFPWLYLKLIGGQSDFLITGWAILCTMYFFSSYDNTFRFTGLSLQLAYPVLFYLLIEKFKILKK